MKAGEYMKYFEAHDIPTYTATGEKGDITTSGENKLCNHYGGDARSAAQLYRRTRWG